MRCTNLITEEIICFYQSSGQNKWGYIFHFSSLIDKLHFVLNTEIKYDFLKIRILLFCTLINLSVLLPKHQSCVKVSCHVLYQKRKEKWSSFLLPALHKMLWLPLCFDVISMDPCTDGQQRRGNCLQALVSKRCIIHMHAHFPPPPFFLVVLAYSWVLQRAAKWKECTALSSQYGAQGSAGCICAQW